MLQQYLGSGGSEEELLKFEVIDRVDADRAIRLADEYTARHGNASL